MILNIQSSILNLQFSITYTPSSSSIAPPESRRSSFAIDTAPMRVIVRRRGTYWSLRTSGDPTLAAKRNWFSSVLSSTIPSKAPFLRVSSSSKEACRKIANHPYARFSSKSYYHDTPYPTHLWSRPILCQAYEQSLFYTGCPPSRHLATV